MTITFKGAAQIVTGSSYLLNVDNLNILIDFGLFQGQNEQVYNFNPLNFDPSEIDAVLLTHAHLDHCGLLPLLIKRGFKGPIYSTIQSKQIAEVILLDSAKIQELNAIKTNSNEIYNTLDALATLSQFQEVDYNSLVSFKSLSFSFLNVGHVLGAASIIINTSEGSILFSGDIGRVDQSILNGLDKFDNKKYQPKFIVMESLYASLSHESRDSSNLQLLNIIKETIAKEGSVFIPVFALHRAQEMLNILKHFFEQGHLSNDIDVYLDSPMALKITNIYKNNSSLFSPEFSKSNKSDPFNFDNLSLIKKSKKSIKISNKRKSIILAGSGMAEGGRIVRHLFSALNNTSNSIVFVGFQAEGTLGRALCDGNKKVLIDSKEVLVKARVSQLHGYSAHGDNEDLLYWLNSFGHKNLNKVFLVHSEKERAQNFQSQLNEFKINSYIPNIYETVKILD
jgi:metallo-beta-lactamase family protein